MRKDFRVIALLVIFALSSFLAGCVFSYTGPDLEVRWKHTISVSGSTGGVEDAEETSDGGFVLVGWTITGSTPSMDFALVKVDANGSQQMTNVYEDTNAMALSVIQTTDSGYIISGARYTANSLNSSLFLAKVDQYGNEEWNETYASTGLFVGYSLQQTADGGYITIGSAESLLVIKTYSNGSTQWRRTYSNGESPLYPTVLQKTSDGGYIFLTHSEYGLPTGSHMGTVLLKIDGAGNPQWNRTFSSNERYIDISLRSVEQTSDGGYILAGGPYNIGEYSFNTGQTWLVKLNSNGSTQWSRAFHGADWSYAYQVRQTSDSGYITALNAPSYLGSSIWLWKTDANGITSWVKLLGSTSSFRSLLQTPDGDYVLAGSVGDGFNGELMKVSGSPPIPVQEIVSALYIVSVSFLIAAVASILAVRVRSREKDAPHDVEPQQEAEKTQNEQSNRA